MKARVYTDEVLASIPEWVKQGMSADEIAAKIGCTPNSLKATCCKKKISLRRDRSQTISIVPVAAPEPAPEPVKSRQRPVMRLSQSANFVLHLAAERRCCDVNDLAKDLLETIARDNLFKAVLDEKENA
jgi:hypothetical protein